MSVDVSGVATELTGIRRSAARQMIAAWEAPAFHVSVDVDMTQVLAARESGSTVTDVLVAVVAQTLSKHQNLNAWYEGDLRVRAFEEVNIGVAVATPDGLTVPIVHEAQRLTLSQIAERRRDVVNRARQRELRREDVVGGTFTISNLGMFGVAEFDAILNVPQVAILAVAATQNTFVQFEGSGRWLPVARLTLTCDHRAVDGAGAAAFLADLRARLETAA